jgi:nitrate reductase beta subunit
VTATSIRHSWTSFWIRNDPKVIEQARIDGIPDKWMEAARKSPVYKMAVDWKVALPLHPEYRTLPMVWYVPPLSPISAAANAGQMGINGEIPDVKSLRIPVKYLANLLTAGDTQPVERALERMLAMRAYQREKHVDGRINTAALDQVQMKQADVEEMYHVMAIANYEDRFVIPSTHREYAENTFDLRGGCGFSFGNGCSDGASEASLFGSGEKAHHPDQGGGLSHGTPQCIPEPARPGPAAVLPGRRVARACAGPSPGTA